MASPPRMGSYALLPGADSMLPKPTGRVPLIALQIGTYFLTALISVLLGYLWGMNSSSINTQVLNLPSTTQTFVYNRSFSYPPSERTDHAWSDIFPPKGTFFTHPDQASKRATFSVYHQLHCLNGLRRGYSANQLAASRGEKLIDESLPADIRASHMRHCIDLIRQSLMCSGDVTLEVVDADIGGVHGFGTEHVCVDWEELKQWTSRQQAGR
ncbi:hypothetical protein F4808DRAFT_432518 [Astrocystis sublimbata]|nr:hypothetical protein F4808DRAFT_432518 [Astrocystis sublimbata]